MPNLIISFKHDEDISISNITLVLFNVGSSIQSAAGNRQVYWNRIINKAQLRESIERFIAAATHCRRDTSTHNQCLAVSVFTLVTESFHLHGSNKNNAVHCWYIIVYSTSTKFSFTDLIPFDTRFCVLLLILWEN